MVTRYGLRAARRYALCLRERCDGSGVKFLKFVFGQKADVEAEQTLQHWAPVLAIRCEMVVTVRLVRLHRLNRDREAGANPGGTETSMASTSSGLRQSPWPKPDRSVSTARTSA